MRTLLSICTALVLGLLALPVLASFAEPVPACDDGCSDDEAPGEPCSPGCSSCVCCPAKSAAPAVPVIRPVEFRAEVLPPEAVSTPFDSRSPRVPPPDEIFRPPISG